MKRLERLLFLTYFQMRSKYRKTLAGFIWVIAYPIISFMIQAAVFDRVLKLNISNYPVFLLAGFLPWIFISQSIISFASVLVHSREILLTFKVHPGYIIGSNILDSFINYLVATLILLSGLAIMGMMSVNLTQIILFFISALVLLAFVFILTSIVSFLHAFYRDVQFVASFLIGLIYFITPIFYTPEFLIQSFPWILKINLFYPVISMFHHSLYSLNVSEWMNSFGISLLVDLGLGFVLLFLLNKKMKDFYINV